MSQIIDKRHVWKFKAIYVNCQTNVKINQCQQQNNPKKADKNNKRFIE